MIFGKSIQWWAALISALILLAIAIGMTLKVSPVAFVVCVLWGWGMNRRKKLAELKDA